MNRILAHLSPAQLEAIAASLRGLEDRLEMIPSLAGHALDARALAEVRAHRDRIGNPALAELLRAVANERRHAQRVADRRLELVWTGPERDAAGTRDTAVVVRELFQSAERQVLIAGYALYNARPIFSPLADRMREHPQLRVRLCVNVPRDEHSSEEADSLRLFRSRFREHQWPAAPLPEVYYDPRALRASATDRSVLHAKCVLVDGARSFVTSANFTEAAHARNIELGVVVNDAAWCRAVQLQFEDLIERGILVRLSFD